MKNGRKYHGLNHDQMNQVLNTMLNIEDDIAGEMTEEEDKAFDIAIQCIATVINRMLDDRPITWDEGEQE